MLLLLLSNSGGGGSNVTVSLSGVSATASPGALAPSLSAALTGVSAATAAGSLSAALSVALAGLAATSAAGTVTASIGGNVTVSLTGVSMTADAGAVVPALSLAVSGGSVTTAAGAVASARTITLTSATASAQAGSVTASGGVVQVRQKGLRKTRYVPAVPPASVQELARYVQQELERLTDGLESPFTHQLYEALSVEPQRKPQGKALIAYANGTTWNPGSGEGLYAFYAGSWKKL